MRRLPEVDGMAMEAMGVRILESMPDEKTVKIRTFSPFFAISPTTAKYAWRTAPHDQFELVIG